MPDGAASDALARIREALGPRGYIDNPADMAPFVEDWSGRYHGTAPMVARPSSTAEVSEVLRIAAAAGLPVIPQGGNTGLCGGAAATGEAVVLSLRRMNRVREVDAPNYTMTAEAGCVLADLQQAAADVDRYFPLSLAAEGSCTIGGNLSTNAGGTNTLRYGNARDLCFGLEVVLPDGTVWDGLRRLRKDNTGYDLRAMFLGSEGTLGVITAAVLKLFPRPRATACAFVAVPGPEAALELLSRARAASGEAVETFEFMPRPGVDMVLRQIPGTQDPLPTRYDFYVLLELVAFAEGQVDLGSLLEDFLAEAVEDGLVLDAAVAQNEAQRARIWALRETLPEAGRREGPGVSFDIAVPIAELPGFYAEAAARVQQILPTARAYGFGHFGDGNLHYSVRAPYGMAPEAFGQRETEIEEAVLDLVAARRGSFSAEHGIGLRKLADMARYKSPVELALMRTLKQAVDPRGIMNPGKVL